MIYHHVPDSKFIAKKRIQNNYCEIRIISEIY